MTKNIPNGLKIFLMTEKYTNKIYQNFIWQVPSKYTQSGIFGMKIRKYALWQPCT
jgi:hypothetical protein